MATANLLPEDIECCSCRRSAPTTILWVDGKAWYFIPSGWFAADTYPPGDEGMVFACSAECAVARSSGG